jgi:hypothetical protein
MPKAKMKFPPIPGETPREKFENLVRFLFSVGKNPHNDKRETEKPTTQKQKSG